MDNQRADRLRRVRKEKPPTISYGTDSVPMVPKADYDSLAAEAIAHLSRRVKTPWRKLYAEGYRVVPVVLTEVPAPRGGKGGA